MIKGIAFQTKARTVDHLGREQIADCPTAISELWKNSYDAYASLVSLNIFDEPEPVAALFDNGHGMNRTEFIERWLVVGTESKAVDDTVLPADRNGLRVRSRQGQKGIGRLSSANLGPILLLVSKRAKDKFVAALLDWRLFENPYLNLSDIFIPVTEFSEKEELFEEIPKLFESLMNNVWGGKDKEHSARVKAAWQAYDALHPSAKEENLPSKVIASTIINTVFKKEHFEKWNVWSGDSEHGTALLISRINYDLRVQVMDITGDAAARAAREKFFETLTSFIDPFISEDKLDLNNKDPQFSYEVNAWHENVARMVVGSRKEFNRHMVEPMEHTIDGIINEKGVFHGRIKAFGDWLEEECVIEPPKDLEIPARADSRVGPLDFFIASMEFQKQNTTHSASEHKFFEELAEKYAGFMIFRNGLRVLPYGRTDNDFFEIESRRSKNAGREFWNHRQMFGRIAISREKNPNLRDKAGREGLLDNRSAKTLKGLIENILEQSARRYFGSASDIRNKLLPELQKKNESAKAKEAQNKHRKKQRAAFKVRLSDGIKTIPSYVLEVEKSLNGLPLKNEKDVNHAREVLDSLKERLLEYRLPGAPSTLGSLEDDYKNFKDKVHYAQNLIESFEEKVNSALESIKPAQPKEILEKQLARNAAQIHRRTAKWKKEVDALQKSEFNRARDLFSDRNKIFHAQATSLINHMDRGEMTYKEASQLMEKLRDRIDEENGELFEPYISALESLSQSIDLEQLAAFGANEAAQLRTELDRLNSLAQLGIAVEIIGHELEAYDDIIGAGLRKLPEDVMKTTAVQDIQFGYDGLTDQLRFLSPLKLSGQRIERWISGEEILNYAQNFFGPNLAKSRIKLTASDAFKRFKVFDQQSRLYPVFINLINNSRYWLGLTDLEDREIRLDVIKDEVVISDNGPGVNPDDIGNLFTLFFTKKLRGGRGVGLYLSRANLAAGGHKISYSEPTEHTPLPGANFFIKFRGAQYD